MANNLREQWIARWQKYVDEITKGTGIFPATVFTIAIVESSARDADGNMRPANSWLAKNAYNLFGIKKGVGWNGATVARDDDKAGELFRKYPNQNESFKDFVKFLQSNPRYKNAGVFSASTPAAQLKAIANAGYSTTATYGDTLAKIGEQLHKFLGGNKTAIAGTSFGTLITLAAIYGLYQYSQKGKKQ